ncbi:speckle targeted PIP5K1A-regulated poly(A) polymerase-like [Stegodyphus dumicola]|uniref:speckle targeted PIP5K1A-regulated poly(A) polymerase-like n=1 Tax=Stegodyphus dumicola TaxID=202533 RepID=UPI0015AEB4D7|nr:speckle targeted PIP5K1A-regulated poly(A) polymerase-like [Stegodyphus dumicola]XP_035214540.1 speckle targeted PIP5K1A-regulated poly(A) polymerase-like [Stegodyphus dumicola]
MKKLCEFLCLSAEDLKIRFAIREDVLKILSHFYPKCVLLIYGSTINGYGFKESDLDLLFLPHPEYCNTDSEIVKLPSPPTTAALRRGFPYETFLKMDETCQLRFVTKLLRSHPQQFTNIFFISARCPVINIVHKNFGLKCDVTCTNRLVVYNTELLRLYGEMDARVKPLIMTIRCWTKSLGFIKQGGFTSYAINLLIIFFLQNVQPAILPSVQYLMKIAEFSHKIGGWECAFTTNLEKIPKSRNRMELGQLLFSFFEFYWKFDFLRNIVSPHIGHILPIKEVKESTAEMLKSFPVTAICVQDPFILSFNTSRNVSYNLLMYFKIALNKARNIFYCSRQFELLFDADTYKSAFEIHYPCTAEKSVVGSINVCYDTISVLGICDHFENLWCARACQAVLDVLQAGLLFECEVIDKSFFIYGNTFENEQSKYNCMYCKKYREFGVQNSIRTKSNAENHTSSCNSFEFLMAIQCTVYCRTYIARKKYKVSKEKENMENILQSKESENIFQSEDNEGILNSEYNISCNMIESNPILSSSEPLFHFLCECYKHNIGQLRGIVTVLTPLTISSEVKSSLPSLLSFITKTVTKLLTDKQY